MIIRCHKFDKRYKEKKKRDFEKLFSGYYLWGRSNMLADMFSETQFPNNTHITEADAGQKAIDERKRGRSNP